MLVLGISCNKGTVQTSCRYRRIANSDAHCKTRALLSGLSLCNLIMDYVVSGCDTTQYSRRPIVTEIYGISVNIRMYFLPCSLVFIHC